MNKTCLKCGGETLRHDENDHHDCRVVSSRGIFQVNEDGETEIRCISAHENDEVWHICVKCDVFHLECPHCHEYCRLTGFPGEKVSDITEEDGKYYHVVKSGNGYLFELYDGDREVYDEMFPEGYVPIPEKWDIRFLDRKQWYYTGIDGSRFSKLECKKCNYILDCFD